VCWLVLAVFFDRWSAGLGFSLQYAKSIFPA
jgi:hypothetical protein